MFSILLASLYVFIGGPSVGKTSTLHILKEMGELVIEEAATDVIQEEQAAGIEAPWLKEDFCWHILQRQLARENTVFKTNKRVFVDRGIYDHFAYLAGQEHTSKYKKIASCIKEVDEPRYSIAFYFEPWNQFTCEKNAVRRESTEEAYQIAALIRTVYQNYVPDIIDVPGSMTPQERALFILEAIRNTTEEDFHHER